MIIVNGLLCVCTSNTCMDSRNHHHSQDTDLIGNYKDALVTTPPFLLTPGSY